MWGKISMGNSRTFNVFLFKPSLSEYLSDKELQNHSFYNAFCIKKEETVSEGMVVKLRVKRLPQDEEWEPSTGIRILKPNTPFEPVGSADFRVEQLMLPKVMEGLLKYFRRMPTQVRVGVDKSWSRLKDRLESLERRKMNLPKMRLKNLPTFLPMEDDPHLPDEFSFVDEAALVLPELIGDVFEEDLFDSNVCKNLDVVVYTDDVVGRPWVGRVLDILEERRFVCHWYQRHGRSLTFADKSPYVSQLENRVVMMWDISQDKTSSSFNVTPYKLGKILDEYKKYDDMPPTT